jgi:hypothetical protein
VTLIPVPTDQLTNNRLNAALDLLLEYLLGQSDLKLENEPVTVMTYPENNLQDTQPLR